MYWPALQPAHLTFQESAARVKKRAHWGGSWALEVHSMVAAWHTTQGLCHIVSSNLGHLQPLSPVRFIDVWKKLPAPKSPYWNSVNLAQVWAVCLIPQVRKPPACSINYLNLQPRKTSRATLEPGPQMPSPEVLLVTVISHTTQGTDSTLTMSKTLSLSLPQNSLPSLGLHSFVCLLAVSLPKKQTWTQRVKGKWLIWKMEMPFWSQGRQTE